MYREISNIKFDFFIGQRVTEVNTEKNAPLGMTFERATSIIGCPWRLRFATEILVGYSDCLYAPERFSHKDVEKLLLGKKIKHILLYEEIADLIIEFEGNIYLELFHESNYFEGWELQGDNSFHLYSLPGGSYALDEPL